MRKLDWVVAFVVAVWCLLPAISLAAEEKPKTTVLDEVLELLLERGQISKEKYQELKEKAKEEQKAEQKARSLFTVEKGRPTFRSADGNYELYLAGRVHTDFTAPEDGAMTLTGEKLNSNFLLRRARIGVGGKFWKWLEFYNEIDFATEDRDRRVTKPTDAFIRLNVIPAFDLTAGQFKEPFGLEQLTSARFIDFIERSFVDELVPARDLGVMARGKLASGILEYAVGGFNGAGLGVSDPNTDKDLAARLVVAPFKTSKNPYLKGLQVAGNVTLGDQDTATSAQGRTVGRTTHRFTFFTANPTRGNRTRWGGSLAWLVGPVSLKGEYVQQRNDRDGLGTGGTDLDEITAEAWYVALTWLVTGDPKTLAEIPVKKPLKISSPFAVSGTGAVELAFRYMQMDFRSDDPVDFCDGDIKKVTATCDPVNKITGGGATAENGAKAITFGVNWHFNPNLKFMVNFTNYWFDNALGTPFSFDPATKTLAKQDETFWEISTSFRLWW